MLKGATLVLTIAAVLIFLMLALTPAGYNDVVDGIEVSDGYASSTGFISPGETVKVGDTAHILSYTQYQGDHQEFANRYYVTSFGLKDGRTDYYWARDGTNLDWPDLTNVDLIEDEGRLFLKGWTYDRLDQTAPSTLTIFELDPETMMVVDNWTIPAMGNWPYYTEYFQDGILYSMPGYIWDWNASELMVNNVLVSVDLVSGKLIDQVEVPLELCTMHMFPFGDVFLAFNGSYISQCFEYDMHTGTVTRIDALSEYEAFLIGYDPPIKVCGNVVVFPSIMTGDYGLERTQMILAMDSSYNVVEGQIFYNLKFVGNTVMITGADENGAFVMMYEEGVNGFKTYMLTPDIRTEPLMLAYAIPLALLGVAAVVQFDKRWK